MWATRVVNWMAFEASKRQEKSTWPSMGILDIERHFVRLLQERWLSLEKLTWQGETVS